MKAIISEATGIDHLVVRNVPNPAPPQRDEIQVRIKAVGLNARDLLKIENWAWWGRPDPIPGCDGAGEVVAVGPEVTRWKIGDRVITSDYSMWVDGQLTPQKEALNKDLAYTCDGCMVELFTMSQDAFARMPSHLSWEEAGVLSCTGVTAWNAVVNKGGLRPGQTVLLLGTGGVAIFALQFAKMIGARTIITGVNDDVLEKAKHYGADEVINFTTTPDWYKSVLEMTGGQGVDLTVETCGAATFNQSLLATRQNGTIADVGYVTGTRADIDISQITIRCLTLKGFRVGSTEHLEQMVAAVGESGMHPVIDSTFDLADIRGAFSRLKSGLQFGKIAVRMS